MKKFFATVAMTLSLMCANAVVIPVYEGYVFGNEDVTNAELKRFPSIYDAVLKVKDGDQITIKVTSVASEDVCADGPSLSIKNKWKDVQVYNDIEVGSEFTFDIKEYKNSTGKKVLLNAESFHKVDNAVAISGRGITADIFIDVADAEAPATYTNDAEGETTVYYNPNGLKVDWNSFVMFDECHFKDLAVGGQLEFDLKDIDNTDPKKPAQVALQDHNDWKTFLSNDEKTLTNPIKVLVPIVDDKMVWTVGEDETQLAALNFVNGASEGFNLKGQNCKLTRIAIRSKAAVEAGISGIMAESKKADTKVYNLCGQMVSENGSLEELPQGVYIKNGKAVIKK